VERKRRRSRAIRKLVLHSTTLISIEVACSLGQAAQTAGQSWTVTTVFPRDTVSGEAVSQLSHALSWSTDHAIVGSEEFAHGVTLADLSRADARQSVHVAAFSPGTFLASNQFSSFQRFHLRCGH
jgi:hypothetical protein